MVRLKSILFIILLASSLSMQAINTRTTIFNSDYKSLKVSLRSNSFMPAIMNLDGNDVFDISFDNLAEDRAYLCYRLVHCNADWQPSSLVDSEFLDGFNYATIDDYAFSATTFTHYVHYSFSLPNDNMRITKSGNYLVQVFPENEPERVLLQARIMISENFASVLSSVTSRTDEDYNGRLQQVSAVVVPKNNRFADPVNDLQLVVTQNSRFDNEVMINKPLMASPTKVTYEHNPALIFPAGNEYRRIETVAINAPSMGVTKMEYFEPFYHATLVTDEIRATEPYRYDKTQLGRFTIHSSESEYYDTECDYIITHFSLYTGAPITNGKIYIDGEFTNHEFNSQSLMKYDSSTGCYVNHLLLKQGAYNYQYLWVPDGTNVGQTSKVEGDKYQTVNEYLVRAYMRKPGDRYDRLIGFGIAFSGK